VKDMTRWVGDGGMPIISAIGASIDSFGIDGDEALGWSAGHWTPTPLACNPHGVVQAGVHSVVLDAVMNFAVNTGLDGKDRSRATLEMKAETMRVAQAGDKLVVRGDVIRLAKQVAYAEGAVRDERGRLVSRSTGTFLLHREDAEPSRS
jgi:uncharacterized protein (TIGR00369 family)